MSEKMRMLTVTRVKNSTARFKRVILYREDPQSPTEWVGGVPCRRLGSLRNGEMNIFSIPEEETCLITVVEGEVPVENYTVPAGSGQVILSGCCQGKPAAFIFGCANVRPEMPRGVKIALLALLPTVLLVTFLLSFGTVTGILPPLPSKEQPRNYSGDGYVITLTDQFIPMQMEDCEGAYTSSYASVYVGRLAFSQAPETLETMTVDEYALYMWDTTRETYPSNRLTDIRAKDGLIYFDIQVPEDATENRHSGRVYLFKGPDGFWFVEIDMPQEVFEKKDKKMHQWAESFRMLDPKTAGSP